MRMQTPVGVGTSYRHANESRKSMQTHPGVQMHIENCIKNLHCNNISMLDNVVGYSHYLVVLKLYPK